MVTKTVLGPPPYIETPDVNLCYSLPLIINHSLANLPNNTSCRPKPKIRGSKFKKCAEELRAYSPKELNSFTLNLTDLIEKIEIRKGKGNDWLHFNAKNISSLTPETTFQPQA